MAEERRLCREHGTPSNAGIEKDRITSGERDLTKIKGPWNACFHVTQSLSVIQSRRSQTKQEDCIQKGQALISA